MNPQNGGVGMRVHSYVRDGEMKFGIEGSQAWSSEL